MTLGWTCRRLRPALVDLALGTLPMSDVPRVEAHVAACADCRADLDTMREVAHTIAPAATASPPEDFWRRQRQAIMRGVRTAPAPMTVPTRVGGWQLAGALATVLLAVLVTRSVVHLRPPLPHAAEHLDDDALLRLHDLLPALTPAASIEDAADDADEDLLSVHDLGDDELDSLADPLENDS